MCCFSFYSFLIVRVLAASTGTRANACEWVSVSICCRSYGCFSDGKMFCFHCEWNETKTRATYSPVLIYPSNPIQLRRSAWIPRFSFSQSLAHLLARSPSLCSTGFVESARFSPYNDDDDNDNQHSIATLLPLGSIHMVLYNSYNGLLIVALKLFKKQYKRKWFYGTFCLVVLPIVNAFCSLLCPLTRTHSSK